LQGGSARDTCRGKVMGSRGDAPDTQLLSVKPYASASTASAYAAWSSRAVTTPDSKPILFRSQPSDFSASLDLNTLQNDFEPVVLQLEPEIERAKGALVKAGARAEILSGRGSAVLG